MTALKHLAFTGLLVLLGLCVALGSVELLLRASGRHPWRYLGLQTREPAMYDPDAELGWRPRPGAYIVPAYSAGAPDIPFTLQADGTRASGSPAALGTPAVAFVGCSLTLGWAIADEETFAWRLQQDLPSVRILNYGRGAYGTYQSLLLMERLMARPDPPRLVLYGFMEQHESRNVADPSWLRALDLFSKKGMVATPYCTLDDGGRLVRHPPIEPPKWPLRNYLASVAFLEERYTDIRGAARSAQSRAVTDQLLLEMDRLAQRHGARFGVVLLYASPEARAHYLALLERHDIDVVDCVFRITPSLRVPGEGHPNGAANARWAKCIEGMIRDSMGDVGVNPVPRPDRSTDAADRSRAAGR